MRTYNANKFKQFNKRSKDIADKNWCQEKAVNALPPHLLQMAHAEPEPILPRRPRPCYTPPIKGFDFRKYAVASAEEEDDAV